jgi:hypothetical protein
VTGRVALAGGNAAAGATIPAARTATVTDWLTAWRRFRRTASQIGIGQYPFWLSLLDKKRAGPASQPGPLVAVELRFPQPLTVTFTTFE